MVRQLDYDRSADAGDRPRVARAARRPVPPEPRGASTAGGRCGGRRRARRLGHDGAARPDAAGRSAGRRRGVHASPGVLAGGAAPERRSVARARDRRADLAAGLRRTRTASMWNAGVVASSRRHAGIFDRTLAVFDEIRPVTRYFAVDQLACSIVLAAYAPIEEAAPWFDHYWGKPSMVQSRHRAVSEPRAARRADAARRQRSAEEAAHRRRARRVARRGGWRGCAGSSHRLYQMTTTSLNSMTALTRERCRSATARPAARRARRPRADGRRGPVLDRDRRDLSRRRRWPPGSSRWSSNAAGRARRRGCCR